MERDDALTQRDEALQLRDAALMERERAILERDGGTMAVVERLSEQCEKMSSEFQSMEDHCELLLKEIEQVKCMHGEEVLTVCPAAVCIADF